MAALYQRSTTSDARAAWESPALIISVLLLGAVGLIWYIASERFHLRQAQIAELSFYILLFLAVHCDQRASSSHLPATARTGMAPSTFPYSFSASRTTDEDGI